MEERKRISDQAKNLLDTIKCLLDSKSFIDEQFAEDMILESIQDAIDFKTTKGLIMKTTKEDVENALAIISNYSNSMSNKDLPDVMTLFLSKEHRTLQQTMMKAIIQLIINYSEFDTDDRNFNTVNTAKKIKESIENDLNDGKYTAPLI